MSAYDARMRGLAARIRRKDFTLTVVGLGRVGLPLCIAFASAGVRRVYGCDKNTRLLRTAAAGRTPFKEEGLGKELQATLARRNLSFTSSSSYAAARSDVVIVCVGTPLTNDNRPDISYTMAAIDEVCPHLNDGALLVFRSTLVPGMMRSLMLPHIRQKTKKRIGTLVCPERIVEGKALKELRILPEIVGSEDEDTARAGKALFSLLGRKRILMTDFTSAETAKIYSNIYRYVNFALANEFAILAEGLGVNAREAIRIANAGYKRGGIPAPGPSGGPCLYKDGHFLIGGVPYVDFIRTAWHLNESIPQYIVSQLKKNNGELFGKKIGVLGLTYKRDSDDMRYSPAAKLVESLQSEGARVQVHDPYVKTNDTLGGVLECEIVIVACDHTQYTRLRPKAFKARYVYDCWGLLRSYKKEFEARAVKYKEFGEG